MIAWVLDVALAVLEFLVGGVVPPEARDWISEPLEDDEETRGLKES